MAPLLHPLLNFCYPAACPSCSAPHPHTAFLCPSCLCDLLELEQDGACPKCAMPLTHDSAPCPYCQGKGLRPFDKVLRLSVFSNPIKPTIHHLKYHRQWPLADHLADRLLQQPDIRDLINESDTLVPVPLHWLKHIRRGYNQSTLLAQRLAPKKVAHPARRVFDTPTQTGQPTPSDRWQNVRHAFRLTRPSLIRHKRVLVIDDVMTTGSTLRALGSQLAKAQPASLSALVLAIADPKGRGFEAI